jgi:hypothetical protein
MSEKKDYRKIEKAPFQNRASVILKLTEKSYKFVRSIKETCYSLRNFFFVSFSNKGSIHMFNIFANTF